MVGSTRFTVDSRYTLYKPLGQGAYGVLCSAEDAKTGELVAIKKLRHVFETSSTSRRALREIKLLRQLQHENVLSLLDIVAPQSYKKFDDVYMVTELMDTDLHNITRSGQFLSDAHISYFIYQILRGLSYIHSSGVLHRDLKPANVLVNANCDIKIADFGMARTADPLAEGYMTGYITTRWYRAPEVILSWREYTKAVDVWSAGCILAEMIGRAPIFPGRDYNDQLKLIFQKLGSPSQKDLKFIRCETTRKEVAGMPRTRRIPFKRLYPQASPGSLDLMRQLLTFVPKRRISARESLKHPYLKVLHDPSDEPEAKERFDFRFEQQNSLSTEECKRLVWAETRKFHPHLPRLPPSPPTNSKEQYSQLPARMNTSLPEHYMPRPRLRTPTTHLTSSSATTPSSMSTRSSGTTITDSSGNSVVSIQSQDSRPMSIWSTSEALEHDEKKRDAAMVQ